MFPLPADELLGMVTAVMWPFLRIGAMFLAAPVFGAQRVPVPVRVLLSFTIALLIMPMLPAPPDVSPYSGAGMLISLQQIALGLIMGFTLHMMLSVFAQAGEAMALSMGLGFASITDPQNGLSVPVISQFYVLIATLMFLALNGHLIVIGILVDSFHLVPVGINGLTPDALWHLVIWGSRMYAAALFLALPVIAAMLLVNLALGVVTRAAPQLNMFAVGFPAMLMIGILAMLFSVSGLQVIIEQVVVDVFSLQRQIIGG